MNFKVPFLVVLGLPIVLASPIKAYATEKIFIDSKCNKCHAVSAFGIARAAADEEDGEPTPDLSNAGSLGDAATLTAYLKKEAPLKAGAKKHVVKFKGTDADLTSLVNWLVTLKKEPVK